jgi:hypothetical protein
MSVCLCGFCLMSVSFWPVFVERFSHQAVLMIFWESVAFFLLAVFLKSPKQEAKWSWAIVLGLWTGLGFYTYYGWPIVAALVVVTVFAAGKKPAPLLINPGIWFCLGMLLTLIPLIVIPDNQYYLDYLSSLLAFHLNGEKTNQWNLWQNLHYFTSFFWEGWRSNFAYNPRWGGFLNPVLASLFFLGIIEFFKHRAKPLVRWFGFAFVVLFFPILLATNTNWFHVVSLMPIFLILTAVGVQVLFQNLERKRPMIILLTLTLASVCLDWNNLEKTREYINASHPSVELSRAYHRLVQTSQERGPGLIFTDLWLKPWPPFLGFSTTPFNLLRRKEASLDQGSWAAIVTNVNHQPFLKRRFPDGKAYWISKDRPYPDGGVMLWIMSVTHERLPVLAQWQQASQALRPFLDYYTWVSPSDNRDYGQMLDALSKAYPFFRGDAFLESIFGEIKADIYFRQTLREASNRGKLKNVPILNQHLTSSILNKLSLQPSIESLQDAIKHGYPAAHLYYQLGAFQDMCGNGRKAMQTFRKATQAPLNFTQADVFLKTHSRK